MALPYADCCGCCGRELKWDGGYWCRDCAAHVAPPDRPLWERTFFAQFGKLCPFEGKEEHYEPHWPFK